MCAASCKQKLEQHLKSHLNSVLPAVKAETFAFFTYAVLINALKFRRIPKMARLNRGARDILRHAAAGHQTRTALASARSDARTAPAGGDKRLFRRGRHQAAAPRKTAGKPLRRKAELIFGTTDDDNTHKSMDIFCETAC